MEGKGNVVFPWSRKSVVSCCVLGRVVVHWQDVRTLAAQPFLWCTNKQTNNYLFLCAVQVSKHKSQILRITLLGKNSKTASIWISSQLLLHPYEKPCSKPSHLTPYLNQARPLTIASLLQTLAPYAVGNRDGASQELPPDAPDTASSMDWIMACDHPTDETQRGRQVEVLWDHRHKKSRRSSFVYVCDSLEQ